MKIAVSHDREYANVLYIERYHHSFRIAGGVNQPKILESVLSDGSTFRELVLPFPVLAYFQVKGK